MPTVHHSLEVKRATLEIPVAGRDDVYAVVRQVSIKIRNDSLQRMPGLLLTHGLGNHPQAKLLAFQSSLAVGDQRVEEILFRLVEQTHVRAPGHVADDVDSGLPHLGGHRGHLQSSPPARLQSCSSATKATAAPNVIVSPAARSERWRRDRGSPSPRVDPGGAAPFSPKPMPASSTATTAQGPSSRSSTAERTTNRRRCGGTSRTASAAFINRFRRTCCSWIRSPLGFTADSRAQGRLDGVEQSVASERLSEECDGTGLEGSPARLFVAVRGQNDNWDPGARGGQMPEEVEPIHPGHPQIEHQTAGVRSMSGLQELFRGGERLDPETDRRQEIPDGPTQ